MQSAIESTPESFASVCRRISSVAATCLPEDFLLREEWAGHPVVESFEIVNGIFVRIVVLSETIPEKISVFERRRELPSHRTIAALSDATDPCLLLQAAKTLHLR